MSMNTVRKTVSAINAGETFTPTQQHEALQLLIDHECWIPLFQLLDAQLKNEPDSALSVFLQKIKIEIKYLNDYKRVAQRAREIVKRFGVDFAWFRLKVLSAMEGNWYLEAEVLKTVCLDFRALPDQVKCMEKICSLYEKKIPDEELLQKYYRDLLKLDPKNIFALKYFKLLYSQNFDWERVIDALRKIMRWGNISDTYRAAQELATVHLYSKNNPQEALRIMTKHCADSPLDKSTILYDIHARLGNDRECVQILKKKLAAARLPAAQAQLHIRIAALQDKCGDGDAAVHEYEQAFEKDPQQVEVVEKIIRICLQANDLPRVLDWLRKLENRATERKQRERLRGLQQAVKKRLAEMRASA